MHNPTIPRWWPPCSTHCCTPRAPGTHGCACTTTPHPPVTRTGSLQQTGAMVNCNHQHTHPVCCKLRHSTPAIKARQATLQSSRQAFTCPLVAVRPWSAPCPSHRTHHLQLCLSCSLFLHLTTAAAHLHARSGPKAEHSHAVCHSFTLVRLPPTATHYRADRCTRLQHNTSLIGRHRCNTTFGCPSTVNRTGSAATHRACATAAGSARPHSAEQECTPSAQGFTTQEVKQCAIPLLTQAHAATAALPVSCSWLRVTRIN